MTDPLPPGAAAIWQPTTSRTPERCTIIRRVGRNLMRVQFADREATVMRQNLTPTPRKRDNE